MARQQHQQGHRLVAQGARFAVAQQPVAAHVDMPVAQVEGFVDGIDGHAVQP